MFNGFFGYLIGGAIIGVLARILKPGPENVGMIMTILIGAAGAAIAGALTPGGGAISWVVAIVAAIVLLVVYQRAFKRPGRHDR
ncbi:GlsB/YeaQ/YmgE family stress response membrane protein [Cognatilysobacter segetis]|uniref:GlsB/YeaQ/YmgE family stress response membrane protein n=1 Tax=Cognatilysobacter segetis TaxID=2492394 RepID=UPI001061F42F|nr:GlsB/YeaQ/YmgE family stress response membrane protein [Lysobacter segetis]